MTSKYNSEPSEFRQKSVENLTKTGWTLYVPKKVPVKVVPYEVIVGRYDQILKTKFNEVFDLEGIYVCVCVDFSLIGWFSAALGPSTSLITRHQW